MEHRKIELEEVKPKMVTDLQDEVQELMGVSTRINGMKNSRHAIS